ncbi:MAG: 4-hydroxy-tetrahydrodipicolinate reductase [Burkholderiaceae bacterium]
MTAAANGVANSVAIRVAIAGASGRMGRTLIEAVLAAPDLQLAAALDVVGGSMLGSDAGAFAGKTTGVAISADLAALKGCNVLIDFTRPEGTLAHLQVCAAHGCGIIIGTTGFDAAGKAAIATAAKQIPIVFAPNMSVGVNVTFKLLEVAAKYLQDGYDVEIFEAHHNKKVDAPSGTAIGMGEAIAKAQGKNLGNVAAWARHGATGERTAGSIGFSVVRGGDVVGDHTAFFLGAGERIEITHRSGSRANYAAGSLRAARFLADKQNGLFDMQDVLGLKDK